MTVRESLPTHAAVSATLRHELGEGRYPDGQPLPVETALCARFRVSRFTIRQALETLVVEGYITRQAGRGTFPIRRDPGAPWVRVVGELHSVMTIGTGTRFEPVDVLHHEQSTEAATRLRLPTRDVWALRGVRHRGEDRVGYWELFLPPRYAEQLGEGFVLDEDHPNMIEVLTGRLGLAIRRAEQVTTAAECPVSVAEHLGVFAGSPVLVIDRMFFDARDEPVQYARSHYRPDEYEHRLDLHPST